MHADSRKWELNCPAAAAVHLKFWVTVTSCIQQIFESNTRTTRGSHVVTAADVWPYTCTAVLYIS